MRPTNQALLMQIAELVAQRSTCNRAQVGAVIARDYRIISTGYGGAPSGLPHCTDVGCDIDPKTGGCIRTVHAEANAIAYAARYGISTAGADLYTTLSPCISCAKLIVAAGICRVYYNEKYRDASGLDLLTKSGVTPFKL